MVAVRGDHDRLGGLRLPDVAVVVAGGRRIGLIHGRRPAWSTRPSSRPRSSPGATCATGPGCTPRWRGAWARSTAWSTATGTSPSPPAAGRRSSSRPGRSAPYGNLEGGRPPRAGVQGIGDRGVRRFRWQLGAEAMRAVGGDPGGRLRGDRPPRGAPRRASAGARHVVGVHRRARRPPATAGRMVPGRGLGPLPDEPARPRRPGPGGPGAVLAALAPTGDLASGPARDAPRHDRDGRPRRRGRRCSASSPPSCWSRRPLAPFLWAHLVGVALTTVVAATAGLIVLTGRTSDDFAKDADVSLERGGRPALRSPSGSASWR